MREATVKASTKGKEELNESRHISEEEDEVNFFKKLQRGSGRFRGKLPFKCFACGRFSHYAAKCPLKDKHDKGKEYARWNIKQNVSKKSYYTHEDSDGLSNSDEDENSNDYRLLMAYDDDNFWDALEEDGLHEEISKLNICLEEKNMIIDTLTYQLAEREKHNEKLECEIVGLRKDLEKTKSLDLIFSKGSETLNEIIKAQHSPLIKTGLGYYQEASQSQKLSTSTKSYPVAAKNSEQCDNHQQRHKADHQVNRFDNRKNFFNGQCFSCHNFGHNTAQCVSYKTIMTSETRNQRNVTGIKKSSYNKFSLLENEIEFSIYNNFGHEESKCRSKFRKISQKEQTPLNPKIWRRKEPQTERCGIALYAEGQENQWYINSECSKHMTGDKEKLHSYNALEKEKNVSFGNDTRAVLKGKGSVFLKEKVKYGNVMYVDGLKNNRLSVSQMCDQGNEVVF
eukprot:PITA_20139